MQKVYRLVVDDRGEEAVHNLRVRSERVRAVQSRRTLVALNQSKKIQSDFTKQSNEDLLLVLFECGDVVRIRISQTRQQHQRIGLPSVVCCILLRFVLSL